MLNQRLFVCCWLTVCALSIVSHAMQTFEQHILDSICTEAIAQQWLELALECANTQKPTLLFAFLPPEVQGRIFAQIHPMQDVCLWDKDDPMLVKTIRIPAPIDHFALHRDYLVFSIKPVLQPEKSMTKYCLFKINIAEPTLAFFEAGEAYIPHPITYTCGWHCEPRDVRMRMHDGEVSFGYTLFRTKPYERKDPKWVCEKTIDVKPKSLDAEDADIRFFTLLNKVNALTGYWDSYHIVEDSVKSENVMRRINTSNTELALTSKIIVDSEEKIKLPRMSAKMGCINQLPSQDDYRFVTVHKEHDEKCEIKTHSIVSIYVPNSRVCVQHYCVYQAYLLAMALYKPPQQYGGATIFNRLFHKPCYENVILETAKRYDCEHAFTAWHVFKNDEMSEYA